jgi:hypothetical protein
MPNGYIKKDGKVVLALNYLEDESKDFDVRTSREKQSNEQIANWMSDLTSRGPGPRMLEMPSVESDEEDT